MSSRSAPNFSAVQITSSAPEAKSVSDRWPYDPSGPRQGKLAGSFPWNSKLTFGEIACFATLYRARYLPRTTPASSVTRNSMYSGGSRSARSAFTWGAYNHSPASVDLADGSGGPARSGTGAAISAGAAADNGGTAASGNVSRAREATAGSGRESCRRVAVRRRRGFIDAGAGFATGISTAGTTAGMGCRRYRAAGSTAKTVAIAHALTQSQGNGSFE